MLYCYCCLLLWVCFLFAGNLNRDSKKRLGRKLRALQLRQLDIEIARAEVTKGNVIDTCVMSSSRLLYSSIQQFSSRARALSLLEVNVKLYDGSFS